MPQGSPLSPLSNILLDDLDKELNDVDTVSAVMQMTATSTSAVRKRVNTCWDISQFLPRELKLKVN